MSNPYDSDPEWPGTRRDRNTKDAERYRFIRRKQVFGQVPIVGGWLSEKDFDTSIDRLMKE